MCNTVTALNIKIKRLGINPTEVLKGLMSDKWLNNRTNNIILDHLIIIDLIYFQVYPNVVLNNRQSNTYHKNGHEAELTMNLVDCWNSLETK